MKKVLAFSSSNSRKSINQKLLEYVVNEIMEHRVDIIQLTDYPLPIFSEDLEEDQDDYPLSLQMLRNVIASYDVLVISVNEHNRGPSAFFKNTIDWLSRIEYKFLKDRKIMLMSTSTGLNAAKASLDYTKDVLLPRFGGEIIESFSFPSFQDNFDEETNTIKEEVLYMGLTEVVENFEQQIEKLDD